MSDAHWLGAMNAMRKRREHAPDPGVLPPRFYPPSHAAVPSMQMMPSAPSLGMSSALITCACSIRCRLSAVEGSSLKTLSRMSRASAIAGIADCMNCDLKTRLHCGRIQILVKAVAVPADAAMTWLVGIVIQQSCTARTQRTVVIGLDGARHQHAVGIRIGTFCKPLADKVLVAQ